MFDEKTQKLLSDPVTLKEILKLKDYDGIRVFFKKNGIVLSLEELEEIDDIIQTCEKTKSFTVENQQNPESAAGGLVDFRTETGKTLYENIKKLYKTC